MRRVAFPVLVLAIGLLAGGCFGPIVAPTADFTVCPDGADGLLAYWFVSQSSTVPGHYLTSFVWTLGDGTVVEDYGGQIAHRFAAAGTYQVALTVTDDRGASASTTKTVDAIEVAMIRSFKLTLGWPVEVTGEVENRSGSTLTTVTVKAKFYDADGVRLTDATAEIDEIEPGERVRFRIEAEEYASEIFSASAAIQAFTADCPYGPYPPPMGDAPRR